MNTKKMIAFLESLPTSSNNQGREMITTTIEQSKHLLELGIDPNTADMGWNIFSDNTTRLLPILDWDLIKDGSNNVSFVPAWSLSALLKAVPYPLILTKVSTDHYRLCHASYKIDIHEVSKATPIDACVEMIEWLCKNGYMRKEGEE